MLLVRVCRSLNQVPEITHILFAVEPKTHALLGELFPLTGNNLSGTLPTQLFQLTTLTGDLCASSPVSIQVLLCPGANLTYVFSCISGL